MCHGAGYVRLDVPVGHPDFGRAVQCQCKEREIAERERLKLRSVSSLKPFDKKTFATFDSEIPSKSEANGVREAYKVALRYAARSSPPSRYSAPSLTSYHQYASCKA